MLSHIGLASNKALSSFAALLNYHPMRMEQHCSPFLIQFWTNGVLNTFRSSFDLRHVSKILGSMVSKATLSVQNEESGKLFVHGCRNVIVYFH